MGDDSLSVLSGIKGAWLNMLEPPWRHSRSDSADLIDDLSIHWTMWILGWVWAIAGLSVGAFIAPYVVGTLKMANTSFQDWLDVCIAVLISFLTQLLGWLLIFLPLGFLNVVYHPKDAPRDPFEVSDALAVAFIVFAWVVAVPGPLIGAGYILFRYLTWVGPGQATVTTGFVGGFLIKIFLIPFAKALFTGALFGWLMKWLRGNRTTKRH